MFRKTTKVIFKNSYGADQPKCKCMITHPVWDVFARNCPVLTQNLDYGTHVRKDGPSFYQRELKIELDMDFIEYHSPSDVMFQNVREIQAISNKCPFNALVSKTCPPINKSCLKVDMSNDMVTKFDVLYAESVDCPCCLNVDAFDVFKRMCPVCKNKALDGEPDIYQNVAFDNKRYISVAVSRDDYEGDFLWMSRENVKKIQEIAKKCKYSRCRE